MINGYFALGMVCERMEKFTLPETIIIIHLSNFVNEVW